MTTETTLPQFEQGSLKKATNGMTSGDLWNCPRQRIHVDPDFNVRIKDDAYQTRVRSIADSIKVNGFYKDKPLAGYAALDPSGFEIIILTDGHTRLDAVDLAVSEGVEIKDIPMVTKPRGTSMEDLTVALVTGNSGEKLTPFEMATVCKRLVGYGMEVKDIATRLGYGKAYIEGLLDLLAAPKAVRDLVATGKVSATLAVETIKTHGKEAGNVLSAGVEAATASGKGKVTKKHVKAATDAVKPATPRKAAAAQQELPLAGDDVEAQVAAQKAAFFEKAALYWCENKCSPNEKVVLVSFLAAMAELPESDVEPYFEVPAESGAKGFAGSGAGEPAETLRQNGKGEESTTEDDEL